MKKVVEFRTQPGTQKKQYKVRWEGFSEAEESWVDVEEISIDLLQEFWKEGNKGTTYRKRKGRKTRNGNTRKKTLEMIQKEKERILAQIPSYTNTINSAAQQLAIELPPKSYCKFCFNTGHQVTNCHKAPWIVREGTDCCLRCLGKGHDQKECQLQINCWYCKSFNHNIFICPEINIG